MKNIFIMLVLFAVTVNAQTYLLEKVMPATAIEDSITTEKAMLIYAELQKYNGNVSAMYSATESKMVILNDSKFTMNTVNKYNYNLWELKKVVREVKRIQTLILTIMNNGVTDLDDFKSKVSKITTFLGLKDVALDFIKRYPTYNESRTWLQFKALFEVQDVE